MNPQARHQSSRPRRREWRAAGCARSWSRASAPGRLRSCSGTAESRTIDADPRAAGPLSPDEALAGFELEPGYRIELAAAEPLVRIPSPSRSTNAAGCIVAENRGYPDPLEGAPAD